MKSAPLRTPAERLLHATVFEAIALVVCAPVMAWWMGTPLAHMGALTLAISLIAMVWNMVFNALFDRLQQHWGFRRGWLARAAHAVLFELGLVLAVVPLAAWWLDISWWQALLLDIGVLLFFLPYTMVFNWAWDKLRPPAASRAAPTGTGAADSPRPADRATCAGRV